MKKFIFGLMLLVSLEAFGFQDTTEHEISLRHTWSTFSESLTDWHNSDLYYKRKSNKATWLGHINYARAFDQSGVGFEVEVYPVLGKKFYGYAAAGFSPSEILPDAKGGLELFYTLPAAFEISAGMRYFNFNSNEIPIATASLGKYAGNYYLMYRIFYNEENDESSVTNFFLARRYLNDASNFLQLSSVVGSVYGGVNFAQEVQRLSTVMVGIEYQDVINRKWIYSAGIMLYEEEYLLDEYRNRIDLVLRLGNLF